MSAEPNASSRSGGDADENEYLSLYRARLRDLVELTRPAFRAGAGNRGDRRSEDDDGGTAASDRENDNDETKKKKKKTKSGASAQLQLTPLSVLYVQTMIAPLRRLYSWGVPTSEALDCIEEAVRGGGDGGGGVADAKTAAAGVVEVGAGTGYWTSLLRRRGIPVTAYDLHPCHSLEPNGHHALSGRGNPPPFATVRRGGAEAVTNEEDASRVLLLCWPPQEGDPDDVRPDVSGMAATALRSYRGSTVVYVGEVFTTEQTDDDDDDDGGWGLPTARREIRKNGATAGSAFHRALLADWVLRREVTLPRWPGTADSLTVWSRKEQSQFSAAAAADVSSTDSLKEHRRPASAVEDGAAPASDRLPVADPPTNAAPAAPATPADASAAAAVAAQIRAGLMRDVRSTWEEAALAHMVKRVSVGGDRPRRGVERRVVDAVRSRSGVIRRLLLAML